MELHLRISKELSLKPEQVKSVETLLAEGNTIPFIARYRKEATGELDEIQLRSIDERLTYLKNLAARKAEVHRHISEQGKLTPELESLLAQAESLQQVDDIYLPFRPKRRTRATIAKEKGLEPLAEYALAHYEAGDDQILAEALSFVDAEKGVEDANAAIDGAKDIIAERVNEAFAVRESVRHLLRQETNIQSKAVDPEKSSPYEMYYDYQEPLRRVPPHRILAMNRGEREEILKVALEYPEDKVYLTAMFRFLGKSVPAQTIVGSAVVDGCKRLLLPSIERELRGALTEEAEEHAIRIFGQNMKPLLLIAPVRGKTFLAIDPAYRTGCKLAVVGPTGRVLDTGVSYFTPPQNDKQGGAKALLRMIKEHGVEAIAIGNGTGSRESEDFVSTLIRENNLKVSYTIVSEAGASVYSASELAGQELPEYDVTIRGAVSIGRRVLDPLAELCKIDPKAIGVGQYQHDVDQKKLAERLTGVVEDCVNSVGVDLNTASPSLLRYVSGISGTVAKNIVAWRDENGSFKSRDQLKKVPRLGPSAFTQCAGFLRVSEATNILDNTPVHPESYGLAQGFLQALGASVDDLATGRVQVSEEQLSTLAKELGAGLPTLRDIYAALKRPGRDPREDVAGPVFRSDVLQMEDVQEGMVLSGVVRNVIDFGAFVDIGVKQDGLVHISEISDKYIKHPSEALAVGDVVKVRIISIDLKRKRIGLSMKGIV